MKKELTEVKVELHSLNKIIVGVCEQTDRYTNIETELKEQIKRIAAKSDTKSLSDKIGEFEQQLAQHTDYVEIVEREITKNSQQCEKAVAKFTQVEGKLEQFVRRPELELLAIDFKEVMETVQT